MEEEGEELQLKPPQKKLPPPPPPLPSRLPLYVPHPPRRIGRLPSPIPSRREVQHSHNNDEDDVKQAERPHVVLRRWSIHHRMIVEQPCIYASLTNQRDDHGREVNRRNVQQ